MGVLQKPAGKLPERVGQEALASGPTRQDKRIRVWHLYYGRLGGTAFT